MTKLLLPTIVAAATLMFAISSESADALNVLNHGTHIVKEIYFSAVNQNTWKWNRLGFLIKPGRSWKPLDDAENCGNYDIKIIYTDGKSGVFYDVDTCNSDIELSY